MGEHKQQALPGWAKFLNPVVLRSNLIAASIYLAAYEMLKSSVIERVRGFFSDFKNGKLTPSDDYRTHCLTLHKSPLQASLLWLKQMSAIDDSDIDLLGRIRNHRNALAHDLREFLMTAGAEIDTRLLSAIYELVTKIDRWWIREVEMTTNPDFDGQEIADEEITSGNMMFFQLMLQIATGEDSGVLWEMFQKQFASPRDPNGA